MTRRRDPLTIVASFPARHVLDVVTGIVHISAFRESDEDHWERGICKETIPTHWNEVTTAVTCVVCLGLEHLRGEQTIEDYLIDSNARDLQKSIDDDIMHAISVNALLKNLP